MFLTNKRKMTNMAHSSSWTLGTSLETKMKVVKEEGDEGWSKMLPKHVRVLVHGRQQQGDDGNERKKFGK